MSCTRCAVCSSLSLFSTSSRATAVLSAACRACSDSRICARASSSCPLAASANIRSAASQNCASDWRDTALLRRPPRDRDLALRAPARRRDRRGCARTAPTRPSADRARRRPACRASPAPSGFRSFWMRSSCSESGGCDRPARSAAAQAGDLAGDVPRVRDDRGQRDDQPEQQRRRRRSPVGSRSSHGTWTLSDGPRPLRRCFGEAGPLDDAAAGASRGTPRAERGRDTRPACMAAAGGRTSRQPSYRSTAGPIGPLTSTWTAYGPS